MSWNSINIYLYFLIYLLLKTTTKLRAVFSFFFSVSTISKNGEYFCWEQSTYRPQGDEIKDLPYLFCCLHSNFQEETLFIEYLVVYHSLLPICIWIFTLIDLNLLHYHLSMPKTYLGKYSFNKICPGINGYNKN